MTQLEAINTQAANTQGTAPRIADSQNNESAASLQRAQETDLPLVVYTPESPLRHPITLLSDCLHDLVSSRELAWRLLVRNISARYRQTLLGFVWALLPPLGTTAIWVFLNSQNVVNFQTPGIPYALFVLSGMILWQTFADAVMAPLRTINLSRQMLSKAAFPREALILVSIGEVLVDLVVRLVLLVGLFIAFRIQPPVTVWLVPFGVLALVGFGTLLGILLVLIGTLYQDVNRSLTLVMQFWMYLTPVVYPPAQSGIAALLTQYNPISPLLLATRDWLLTGQTAFMGPFFCIAIASVIGFTVAIPAYRVSMPILIERMGN